MPFEDMDALLQTFGDRQVEWLDDLAAVCPGDRFSTEEEVMHFAVDELAVSLEVCLSTSSSAAVLKKRSNLGMLNRDFEVLGSPIASFMNLAP